MSAYCVEEVADSTLSLILSLYRRTHWLAAQSEQKLAAAKAAAAAGGHAPASPHWLAASTPEQTRECAAGSTRVRGQWLGLVGLGKVGLAVAVRARVFGFHVAFYDPNVAEGYERSLGGVTRYLLTYSPNLVFGQRG